MSVKTGVVALVAGLATFFGVGITVTGFTDHWIEFPTLLGLATGSIAGLGVTTSVSVAFTNDVPDGRRRLAGAVAGFGGGFVVGIVAGARVDAIGSVAALGIGFVLGLFVAIGAYKAGPFGASSPTADDLQSETGE